HVPHHRGDRIGCSVLVGHGLLEDVHALVELGIGRGERHHALDHLVLGAGPLDDQAVLVGACGHRGGPLGVGATHADHHAAALHLDDVAGEALHHGLQPHSQVLAPGQDFLGERVGRPVVLGRGGGGGGGGGGVAGGDVVA